MLPCPLPQSDAYARALRALGTDVRIDTIPAADAAGAGRCLIQTRQLPLVGPVNLISRGPLCATARDTAAYLARLKVAGPLVINSINSLDGAGCVRLSAPRTVALLPIAHPDRMRANLHPKWRNALVRAERSGLTIAMRPYHPVRHAWLVQAEQRQQATKGYRNLPTRFVDAFALENPGSAQVVTARAGGADVAAMLILSHAPWATYHMGLTTDAGRKTGAHNLILWHVMAWLWDDGYRMLDLGTLSGPPGLTRFKLRSGAQPETLGGTWLRLPSVLRQHPFRHPRSVRQEA